MDMKEVWEIAAIIATKTKTQLQEIGSAFSEFLTNNFPEQAPYIIATAGLVATALAPYWPIITAAGTAAVGFLGFYINARHQAARRRNGLDTLPAFPERFRGVYTGLPTKSELKAVLDASDDIIKKLSAETNVRDIGGHQVLFDAGTNRYWAIITNATGEHVAIAAKSIATLKEAFNLSHEEASDGKVGEIDYAAQLLPGQEWHHALADQIKLFRDQVIVPNIPKTTIIPNKLADGSKIWPTTNYAVVVKPTTLEDGRNVFVATPYFYIGGKGADRDQLLDLNTAYAGDPAVFHTETSAENGARAFVKYMNESQLQGKELGSKIQNATAILSSMAAEGQELLDEAMGGLGKSRSMADAIKKIVRLAENPTALLGNVSRGITQRLFAKTIRYYGGPKTIRALTATSGSLLEAVSVEDRRHGIEARAGNMAAIKQMVAAQTVVSVYPAERAQVHAHVAVRDMATPEASRNARFFDHIHGLLAAPENVIPELDADTLSYTTTAGLSITLNRSTGDISVMRTGADIAQFMPQQFIPQNVDAEPDAIAKNLDKVMAAVVADILHKAWQEDRLADLKVGNDNLLAGSEPNSDMRGTLRQLKDGKGVVLTKQNIATATGGDAEFLKEHLKSSDQKATISYGLYIDSNGKPFVAKGEIEPKEGYIIDLNGALVDNGRMSPTFIESNMAAARQLIADWHLSPEDAAKNEKRRYWSALARSQGKDAPTEAFYQGDWDSMGVAKQQEEIARIDKGRQGVLKAMNSKGLGPRIIKIAGAAPHTANVFEQLSLLQGNTESFGQPVVMPQAMSAEEVAALRTGRKQAVKPEPNKRRLWLVPTRLAA